MSSILDSHSLSSFFFFNDTATTEIYTLSLHDALPIFAITLPNAVSAIGVARSAIHQAQPEHAARPLRGQTVTEHLVARLAINDRHDGCGGIRFAHGLDRYGHGLVLTVGRLQHIEIEQGRFVRR